MQKIRYGVIVLWMLSCSATFAAAEVTIDIGAPSVNIGINLPLFPQFVRVPNYPVYYAPRLDVNYFFYDGMYWVYQDDNWYASSWYNGPWWYVEPYDVPLYVLRIPVRYYRQPPVYFSGWYSNAPPRWGEHWGHDWERHRSGWDRWQRRSAPAPAPLPVYQRQYSGDRYPRVEQQHTLRSQSYRYQPRDKVVRQHFKQQAEQKTPSVVQPVRPAAPPVRNPKQHDIQRPEPLQHPPQQRGPAVHEQKQHPRVVKPEHQQRRGDENVQKPAPVQPAPQQRGPAVHEQKPQPGAAQHQQQAPRVREQEQRHQDRGEPKEHNRGHGQGQDRDEERGRGRNN